MTVLGERLPVDRMIDGTMSLAEAVEIAAAQVENDSRAPGLHTLTRTIFQRHAALLRKASVALAGEKP